MIEYCLTFGQRSKINVRFHPNVISLFDFRNLIFTLQIQCHMALSIIGAIASTVISGFAIYRWTIPNYVRKNIDQIVQGNREVANYCYKMCR